MNRELSDVLRQALICSVFVDPTDPGLTYAELTEVGRQAGFQNGEIGDQIEHISMRDIGDHRCVTTEHELMFSEIFEVTDPPLLDREAANFVIDEINNRIKADGIRSAKIDRGAVVEKAVAAGRDRRSVQGAITCLVLAGSLEQIAGDVLKPRHMSGTMQPLSAKRHPATRSSPARPRVLAIVRDVIARRADGRPRNAEPLDAFGEALERIGYQQFRSWWRQTVVELRASDPISAPIGCALLSAALVEGALTFAAKYARNHGLDAFRSNDFDGEPRSWKAEKLIDSAGRGGAGAILSPPLKAQAEQLNRIRQRVHVGRLLTEEPKGVLDLRPEEGRAAKATADQVVRAVIDWLDKQPTPSA